MLPLTCFQTWDVWEVAHGGFAAKRAEKKSDLWRSFRDCSATFNWFNHRGVIEIATLKEMEQTGGEKKRGKRSESPTGTGEFWSVMKEKSERGKSSFRFNGVGRGGCVETEVCACVTCRLSFFGPENKIYLAWSLHLSWRNNTNSISPRRVIRNVIYRSCAQICTLGNCFAVLQLQRHIGLSLRSWQHHSPFLCLPTRANAELASMAFNGNVLSDRAHNRVSSKVCFVRLSKSSICFLHGECRWRASGTFPS